MISRMYQYPNLYADLSTVTWVIPRPAFLNYLRELVDAGLGKRLMFGSDQMWWPESIGWAVGQVFWRIETTRFGTAASSVKTALASDTEALEYFVSHGKIQDW